MRNYTYINSQSGRQDISVILILSMLLLLFSPILARPAQAIDMTSAYIRLDRLAASTATSGTICMTPSATHTTALDAVKVTWPTGFTVNTTGSNWAGTGSTLGGATAMPGIASATPTVSTQTVTWTFAAAQTVTASTTYCFTFGSTDTLTNSTAGSDKTGTMELTDATPANSETKSYALAIIASDQVTITASVPATFNFAIADTALALGTLSTSTVETDSMSTPIDIDTNANNGYIAWIRSEGAGAALTSATTSYDIDSTDTGAPVNCSAGSDCYVVDVNTGTGTVASEYIGDADTGGVISTTYEQIASHASEIANETLSLTVNVAISGTVPAADDYTDTWQVVGAGNF